jgi:hypothetical protein
LVEHVLGKDEVKSSSLFSSFAREARQLCPQGEAALFVAKIQLEFAERDSLLATDALKIEI